MNDWWLGLLNILITFIGGVGVTATPSPVPSSQAPPERTTQTVTHVIDGDTIVLANNERVRLLGIDTPERTECFYDPARVFLRDWLEGEEVVLERDVRNRDDYGRLLRYVYSDTTFAGSATATPQLVNQVLLEQGYATVLPIGNDRRYRAQFQASYELAQTQERGRWGSCVE